MGQLTRIFEDLLGGAVHAEIVARNLTVVGQLAILSAELVQTAMRA